MPIHTFGTLVDPAHFVESPDPANPTWAPGRPPAGTHLVVQDYATSAPLADIVTTAYGQWAYSTVDVPRIRVSADGGSTWVGPLLSVETQFAGSTAGETATTAQEVANQALTTANATAAALAAGGGGTTTGGGTAFTGHVDWATQVDNKPDLTATGLGFLPASMRGDPNGVAPLASGLVPIANLPLGTTAQHVASGAHAHSFTWQAMPAGSLYYVNETSAGVYPALPAGTTRTDIKRVWYGSIRPTAAQGLQIRDDWVNTAP
jgi:hypothetical protein